MNNNNNWFLSQVKKGMQVVDAEGEKVGTVKSVHLGGDSEQMNRNDPYQNTIPEIIANVFTDDQSIPETLRNRLEQQGFIVVDRMMAVDPYILPDQILSISGETITLRTAADELITR